MKTYKLHNIAEIKVGYQARKRIELVVNGTHRLIQGKNFDRTHSILPNELASFSPIGNVEKYFVKTNDVIFQARGSEHFACCLTGIIGDNILAANSLYIIRVNGKEIIPEYLAWQINQPKAQAYFNANSGTTIISFVSKNVLGKLKIKIPEINVQKKICKIIDLWNEEKKLTNEIIEKKEKLINEHLKLET